MTNKDHNAFSQLAGNPRFLDRLNAVCSVFLLLVLAAFVLLALHSRARAEGVQGMVDVVERVGSTVAPAAAELALVAVGPAAEQ